MGSVGIVESFLYFCNRKQRKFTHHYYTSEQKSYGALRY